MSLTEGGFTVMDFNFRMFHNALRIMRSLDRDILENAGVLGDHEQWEEFRRDPYAWFLKAPDFEAHLLFRLVENRL